MTGAVSSRVSQNFLRELFTPDNATLDVVAVHGLNTLDKKDHAFSAWTASNGAMWLRDEGFIRTAIPNARILVFSYNANVAFGTSSGGVYEQAENLLNRLEALRAKLASRPIVFLCHSLGGLVVKRALVHAKLNPTYTPIVRATCGIAFFGTPHRGGNHAALGALAASIARTVFRHPNNTFMEALKKSLLAETIREDYKQQLMDYKFLSFYETVPLGKLGLAVDKDSATLGLPGTQERQVALEADHAQLCKFASPEDDVYVQVIHNIKWLVEDAQQIMASRAVDTSISRQLDNTKPTPGLFLVPFPRNRDFVGRDDYAEKLSDEYTSNPGFHIRLAICGLGGVGKSQLALEFAYRFHIQDPQLSVFWVNGGNATLFEQSYASIAKEASLLDVNDKKSDPLVTVMRWLSGDTCGHWLMVVDNADDADVFFGASAGLSGNQKGRSRLASYLPTPTHGSILITTRNRTAGIKLAGSGHLLTLLPLSPTSASTLALKKIHPSQISPSSSPSSPSSPTTTTTTTTTASSCILELVEECMEGLPLAIVQAAAFIGYTGMSVQNYVRIYRASETNAVKLLSEELIEDGRLEAREMEEEEEGGEEGMEREGGKGKGRGKGAVARTWEISFDQIQRTDPEAADMMSFMACLHRQNIPKTLLPKASDKEVEVEGEGREGQEGKGKEGQEGQEDELRFEKSLGLLKCFALITESGTHEQYITMHRLVHLAIRQRLRLSSTEAAWAIKSLLRVSALYPSVDISVWKTCADYLPHAQAVLSYPTDTTANPRSRLARARLLHEVGVYYEEQGKYGSATEALGEAAGMREELLGAADERTLLSRQKQAWALLRHGKYDAAETVCLQALASSSSSFPSSSSSSDNKAVAMDERAEILQLQNLLADIHRRQCRYPSAEHLYHHLLPTLSRLHGPNHNSTLSCKFNLCVVLEVQGQFSRAETLLREVVAGRERAYGRENPVVFDTISRVGCVLNRRGRYGEAEVLHRGLLERRKKVLGEGHPDVLISMRNVAISLREQGGQGGGQEEAQTLFRYVLEKRRERLGADHPYTLGIAYNLARSLFLQGELDKAQELLEGVCKSQEESLGFLHQDTLLSLRQLGNILERQGETARAETEYERTIDGSEKVFGPNHLDTLGAIHDLAAMLCKQDKFHWADEYLRRLLRKKGDGVLGEDKATFGNVVGLARSLLQRSQFGMAAELYRVAVEALDEGLYSPECDQLSVDIRRELERCGVGQRRAANNGEKKNGSKRMKGFIRRLVGSGCGFKGR